ncbi:hypothetical protein REC12_15445 [Desulfosporosinus sp. PR]|uniref:hypothetical protein n=1 Tax=Candidatus Desulfosporosinus nitrosoreducens TaxID=3401928 RepID=UPI0027F4602F|nr:hypothetical protein [Desulfosporosinus sp. PR]MDQ7094990.1 hypothetical protein [Desulfosporosinus sp. PR]
MHDIADTVFGPVIQVLTFAYNYLSNISMVASRGLNLDYFLGPFANMGSAWITLIKSFIGAFVLVSVVVGIKAIYSAYLQLKQGVKWW